MPTSMMVSMPSNDPSRSSGVIVEVAAGLVFRHGLLLLTQRLPGKHLAGLWEFPGGKREIGETWETCLARELREELGIESWIERSYAEVKYSYPERTVHLRFYLCRITEGEPRAAGCAALAWVDRQSLTQYSLPPADQALVERILADDAIWDARG
jgi:8-oxo-dGTP diphosphatase